MAGPQVGLQVRQTLTGYLIMGNYMMDTPFDVIADILDNPIQAERVLKALASYDYVIVRLDDNGK